MSQAAQDAAPEQTQPEPPEWTATGWAEGPTPRIEGPDIAAGESIVLVPKDNDAPRSLAEALLFFQAEPPQVIKDAEADVMSKDGKTKLYSYKYMSLQALLVALRPRLSALGLLWRSKPGVLDGKPVINYCMTHVPSGECDEGTMPLVAGGTMQALGGSISFGRRYALITYLNLAPDVDEDDAIRPEHEVGGKKLTKKLAESLVREAERLGLLPRLQLAASYVHGSDVGDCSTKAKAVTAVQKLNEGEADRLFSKMAEIGGESESAGDAQ